MSSFLTVEDINSVLLEYGDINTFHKIDLGNVGSERQEYIDFCNISCEIEQEVGSDAADYRYSVEVYNNLWTGGFYVLSPDDEPIVPVDVSYNNHTLVFTIHLEEYIEDYNPKLFLYLTNLASEFKLERLTCTVGDYFGELYYLPSTESSDEPPRFSILGLGGGILSGDVVFTPDEGESVTHTLYNSHVDYLLFNGVVKVTYDGNTFYYRGNMIKQVLPLGIDETLIAGKVNTVTLNYPDDLSINVGSAIVSYEGEDFEIDLNTKSFELDLRNKLDISPVNLNIRVSETSDVMAYDYSFELPCEYLELSSFELLESELVNPKGAKIMFVSDNILFDSSILITHDCKLLCGNHSFNLNQHGFILNNDVNFYVENGTFNNGDTVFLQKENSKLNIVKCTFNRSTSSNYNNLGSVVFCDIDIDNLDYDTDFITTIRESSFNNNHSCILHGGQLIISDCSFINQDYTTIDKNNPAFLYQVDGYANITTSNFNINYGNDLCMLEQDVGFGQCVFMLGETASVNNVNHLDISENKQLQFFDNLYNNISSISGRFYHNNNCIIITPNLGKENKAICYCISGNNKVFKENVTFTKGD